MEELDLYQFLKNNGVEMRWDIIDENAILAAWIPAYILSDFSKMIETLLQDGGINSHLCSGGFVWVNLGEICEYYSIEPERIHPVSGHS